MDLRDCPETDPTSIYRYRDGLYATDLLACAIVYLDLFTWFRDRTATKTKVCDQFRIAERPTDVMLTLFTAMGLLRHAGETFELTNLGREHLTRDSQWYLGPYYASLKDRPVCKDFLQVLQTDKAANWGSFKNEKDWARAMEEESFAQNFTAAMDCRGVYLGQAVAKSLDCSGRRRLLDIAGGSGIYACSIVAHHPQLSATVFEKAPVDKVAARAIASRGFADQVNVITGDMFVQRLPEGHDIHLFSNVLHDWNEETVFRLLQNSFGALEPGGMLVVHDVHINREKSGPLSAASYSAMLMHATEGKCYSLAELDAMFSRVGFKGFQFAETAADRSIVVTLKPA
jgi:3-hydroxy-5-methyl-1-naphthoate 3-O-methyltransferase